VEIERQVQARVPDLTASKKSLDSILIEFLRFQFRLKKPYHRFVRVFMAQMFARTEEFLPYMVEMQKEIDPPLRRLFGGLQNRRLIRQDVNIEALITIFKTMHMGLVMLWSMEGPPFRGAEQIVRQEIKLFCEGMRERKT
jgi:hypothetical protein